jgi:hypothetical protein
VSVVPSFTQVGTQFADPDTVDAIRVHTGGAGLLIGGDEGGRPVTVAFFRPEPTVVVVVGRLGLAQLIGFRALALGGVLAVASVRPSAWSALARMSGTPGAVEITWPDRRPERYGSSLHPYLLVFDSVSAAAVGEPPAVQGWSTLVTVRERLTSRDTNLLRRADLILTHALSLEESALLCSAANTPDYTQALTALPVETVATISHTGVRAARLAPTAIERQLIGPAPRR